MKHQAPKTKNKIAGTKFNGTTGPTTTHQVPIKHVHTVMPHIASLSKGYHVKFK